MRARHSHKDDPLPSSSPIPPSSLAIPPSLSPRNMLPAGALATTQFILSPFSKIPAHMKDNPFIFSGYRVDYPLRDALLSLFRIHNETLNVWTHLIGFLMFLSFLVYSTITGFEAILPGSSFTDRMLLYIFFIGAMTQMLCSSLFHLLSCMGQQVYLYFARLDYSGITVMIIGSYLHPLYYVFYCWPFWRSFYCVCIAFLGGMALATAWSSTFAAPHMRKIRAAVFVALGFFGVVPIPHGLWLQGVEWMWPCIWRLALMGAIYMCGVFFYVSRYPECHFPGSVDCTIHSHVIWHIFVLVAALTHFYTLMYIFAHRQENTCVDQSLLGST